ncbi:MAG: hypothetical protein GTO18_02825 [Anaerolineales bacterium]|nr:hypothetical protein [Anaerolineales bacterium]
MDSSAVDKISRKVSKQFPEMKGVRPTVRRENGKGEPSYVLTYKGKIELPGGRKMNRIVRVVANENGKVLRMSTSK